MASFIEYTGDGNATKAFSFPSFAETDVKVEVDEVLKTVSTHYNITGYTTTGGGNVVFTGGNIPASPAVIRIYRETDIDTGTAEYDPKATYTAGSSVKAEDLNNNQKQALYAAKEARDQTITSAKIKNGAVTTAKIAADAVDGTKIADDAIDSEHYAADSIDSEHYAPNSVDADALAHTSVSAGSYTAADITVDAQGRLTAASSGQIAGSEIAGDAIDGSKIADNAVDSEHYTDLSIDTAHIGNSQITLGKLHGDLKQTSVTDDDTKLPTAGAVVDYVTAQLLPFGGFEVIDDEDDFPTSIPASGVVISLKTITNGLVVDSNGVCTTARTTGNGSDNVTINGFTTALRSKTLTGDLGVLVSSSGSSNTYSFHRLLAKDDDVEQLSQDIQDFKARYRTAANRTANNDSSNDDGDLFYDQTANKMYVYEGAYGSGGAWGEVTSTGEFKYLVLCNAGTTNAATYGSATSYDLKVTDTSGSAASVGSAAQLLVSVNGVIQKPNVGITSFTGSNNEGFCMADPDTITFAVAPDPNSNVFAVLIGSAVSLPTPGDDTVTAAKTDISIVQGDIIYGNGTDSWTRLPKGTAGKVLKMNSGATAPEWADDLNTSIGGSTGADFNDDVKLRFGTGNDMEIYTASNNTGQITSSSSLGLTTTGNATQSSLNAWNTSGTPAAQVAVTADSGSNTKAQLYYDASSKLQTTNTGIAVTGAITTSTGATFVGDVHFDNGNNVGRDILWSPANDNLRAQDNTKITFGAGDDLIIHSDGTDSFITSNGAGSSLIIRQNGTATSPQDQVVLQAWDTDNSAYKTVLTTGASTTPQVVLLHDGTKKAETVAGGFTVTGACTATSFAGDGSALTGIGGSVHNTLINGGMLVSQRGTSFVAGANNDDVYTLDRWLLLSDGNDIVDVTQSTQTPTGGLNSLALDVETTNKKFGILQIIEQKNCYSLIGGTASLSFKMKASAVDKLDSVKAAVISWSSTADTVTSDVVSAWGNEGTRPTLATNWTYENTNADANTGNFTPTTSWATYKIENISIDTSSTTNVAVFIWSDVTDTTAGQFLYITDVQLEAGSSANDYAVKSYNKEIEDCQRYFEKETFGSGGGGYYGHLSFGTKHHNVWNFHTEKRVDPDTTAKGNVLNSSNTAGACTLFGCKHGVQMYNQSATWYWQGNHHDDIFWADAEL